MKAIDSMKATHHVEINRKTHRIEQFGSHQPIDILSEYTADCRDCGQGMVSATWEEVQAWAQEHVGIVLREHVNYAVLARVKQDNIERLLQP